MSDPRDLLARTIMAEAGGEGPTGMLAVGAVIANRLRSGQWGDNLESVIMAPGQFSAWNGVTGYAGGQGALDMDRMRPTQDAYAAADAILAGQYQDPTGGALNYYNPDAADPAWGSDDWTRIGHHVFGTAGGAAGGHASTGSYGADPSIAGAFGARTDAPSGNALADLTTFGQSAATRQPGQIEAPERGNALAALSGAQEPGYGASGGYGMGAGPAIPQVPLSAPPAIRPRVDGTIQQILAAFGRGAVPFA